MQKDYNKFFPDTLMLETTRVALRLMAMSDMEALEAISDSVQVLAPPVVPWFPTKIEDFNNIGKSLLTRGNGIQEVDHPCF